VMLTNDDARFTFGSVDIHSVNGEIYLYNTVVNDSAVLETTNGYVSRWNICQNKIYIGGYLNEKITLCLVVTCRVGKLYDGPCYGRK